MGAIFVVGLIIGPVGLYIRSHLDETEEFRAQRERAEPPVRLALLLRDFARPVGASFC